MKNKYPPEAASGEWMIKRGASGRKDPGLKLVEDFVPTRRQLEVRMDNSCFNDLWIDGNNIPTLLQAIEGEEYGRDLLIDFNKITPMPEELDVDECVWQEENWGTCFNAANPAFIHDTSRNLGIRFATFDFPPIKVIKTLARQFPKNRFTLRYYERDAGFDGCLTVKGERIIEESYVDHCSWWKDNRVVVAGRKFEDELSIWYSG